MGQLGGRCTLHEWGRKAYERLTDFGAHNVPVEAGGLLQIRHGDGDMVQFAHAHGLPHATRFSPNGPPYLMYNYIL